MKVPDQYLGARPAIGPDGTIYAVGNFGHLYAVTPQGALKWVRSNVSANATVAVLPNGNIVCGGGGGVMSLSPEGLYRWSFPVSTAIGAGPNVGPDGRIYFIDNSRWGTNVLGMIILDDAGNLVWNGASFYRRGANNNPSEIAFSANRAYAWSDGAISPPFSDTGMNAFNLGGGHLWNDPNAVGIQVSANPSPNVVYCTTSSVTMKSPSGATIWSSQLSAQPQQIVATSIDGSTYLATLNARLNAWNPNGSQRFANLISGILNWLSVSPNGQNIVLQTSDFTNPTQIKSFNPQGAEQWSYALPNEFGMHLAAYSYMNFTPDSSRVIFGSVGPYTSATEAHCYLYSLRTQ